ncbi:MAG: serine/threonine-protein kinase [Nibricoccus sp.]
MENAFEREEDLFEAARKLPHNARREFLNRQCEGDNALRRRIEDLLAASAEAERFFDDGGSVRISQEVAAQFTQSVRAASGQPAHPPGEEPLGSRIGRYKLIEKLGEGGCGVVYRAEQEEPVRRSVALKIIKLGMETKSVIARFEAERQALALMDHPHIARVYDAGATDRGPPYFVMELVQGVKITDYCERNRLTLRERLEMFVQICHAIQHAHQKGVIHGDIKPSNILVAEQDGTHMAKVIDFGISKATEARLTDKALFTTYAQLIGTPAYMSPEQAQMGGVDIDTRSDIYSLGVLLYELLTGRTPFDPKDLIKLGLDEMRRILREQEPARPSVRLNSLSDAELFKTASTLWMEPARLVSSIKGDLDWIVMKALEKDRRRRYETANGLAMDIQRHLDNEPVIARPPSWGYRLEKLVRRNRVVFIAGAAVTAALVTGLSMSTWLFFKEREARERAVAAEQQQTRLRHESEVREKITFASLLVSKDKFEEADRLLNDIDLVTPTVEGAALFRAVGEWHALHGRWPDAAKRLSRLMQLNQLDGWDFATLDALRIGPALIEDGDIAAFDRFREEAIARFISDSSCPFPDRVIKIVLLVPASPQVLGSLSRASEANLKSYKEAVAAGDVFQSSWRALSLGLWEYRRGNHAQAVEWTQKCIACPEFNAPRTATARLVLALSLYALGREAEAREELAAANELIESKLKPLTDRGTPIQGFWFDNAFVRILWREAESHLNRSPK